MMIPKTSPLCPDAGAAPPLPPPLSADEGMLYFVADSRVHPVLLSLLAQDAELRLIDHKIVSCPAP